MRRSLLIAAVLIAAAPAALRAQPDAPVSEDEKAVAREHFQKAKELHEQKQYTAAAAEYLEAYKHMPAPAFIYNAGQVYRLGGEKEKAIEHYKRYLELEPSGEGADDARQFIAELSAAIEAEKSQTGAPAPGGPALGGGSAPGGGTAPPERDTDERPGRGLMVAGMVSGGIGVAALAAAVVFAAKASSAESDLDGFHGTWTPEQRDRYASGETAERNMKVSLAVGAVGLAAGGVMFFLGRRQARAARSPVIGAAADGQSALLLLGGSF